MSDEKRRLPIYTEPTGVEVPLSEELLPYHQGNFITGNCFRFYAFDERRDETGSKVEEENRAAALYFVAGIKALHQGYFEGSKFYTTLHYDYVRKAFAYFRQALAAKPDYFCAREAFRHTAELLGQFDIAENEEYALEMSNNPHPEMPCHLMHPGFYSASDLRKLEESLKEERK